MSYEKVILFITQNPVCTIATMNDTQPHVRAFLTNIIDNKIYFTTSLNKEVGQQIIQNQQSELCYLNSDFSVMLRITTILNIVNDKNIKQYLIDNKPYLKNFRVDDSTFLLFTLSKSKAKFWRLKDNLKEKNLEVFEF